MFTLKSLLLASLALAVSFASASTVFAVDPALRMWQKQHPGTVPPVGMFRGGPTPMRPMRPALPPSVNRSFSFEPGASMPPATRPTTCPNRR